MDGFFSKKETESITRPDGKSLSCISCGLFRECKSPKIKPYGNFKKGILNIGEAPDEVDDRTGKPWQGKVGKILQRTYSKLGIDLFEDCLNINAIQCRPTDTDDNQRLPVNYEIDCCRKIVLRIIEQYKPKVIILLGQSATYSLIGHRWKKDFGTIVKWRGWTIPDQDFKTWLCPTFHPNFIEKDERDSVAKIIWEKDLKQAFTKINEPFPEHKKPKIDIIEDLTELNNINVSFATIDYETTGIKPHAEGHKIVCAAIAINPDHAIVFMMPQSRSARKPFIDFLTNKKISKIAHNMKFEETWSVVKLRQPVTPWEWDTMQAAHILDNRPGITGLKFQTFVQFGIVDYSSELDPYIKTTQNDKDSNSLNKVNDLIATNEGQHKLLTYCAYDAIYEYRLWVQQASIIQNDLPF